MDGIKRVFLFWGFLAACAGDADRPSNPKPAGDRAGRADGVPAVDRPQGWVEQSHAPSASPDYEQVFSDRAVHRIDISLTPKDHQAMLDDLTKLLGAPGTRRFGGPGTGGMGGPPQLPPELISACEGKRASDSCSANGAAGSCRDLFGMLACLPMNLFGGMGPGGMGPIDLVPGDPVYVPATIRYDGRVWTRVAMRFKGNSSLASAWGQGLKKLGFRLHFDRFEDESPEIADQRFFGFRELTFSSGWNDASLIRDTIAAELLRSQGLPAARCAFYRVYVDAGEGPVYWGLYTMIEDPSDALLAEQFESDEGNLYKPDGIGADFSQFSQEGFVKKNNEAAADYSDVMRAVQALHAGRDDAAAWRSQFEQAFDVDAFLGTLAVSRAIGHWDGYGRMAHNYYLYGDPARGGRLTWISWDHNLTWQGSAMSFAPDLTPLMDEVTERWPLIRFLLDDAVYRARYRQLLEEALGGAYAQDAFASRAAELHALISPYVLGENGADAEAKPYSHLSSLDAFKSALHDPTTGLLALAEQRRTVVRSALTESR